MILGEHAVLHGATAIVAAINKRLSVELELVHGPLEPILQINSRLGQMRALIKQIIPKEPFAFVLATIQYFKAELLAKGCSLKINISSHIPPDVGFASSSAVTVATCAAIMQFLYACVPTDAQLFKVAKEIVVRQQGIASGADVAASIYGGLLLYTPQDGVLKRFSARPMITAVYAGYKTATPQVIAQVAQTFSSKPQALLEIYHKIGKLVQKASLALDHADLVEFGKYLVAHQALQHELQVSDHTLDDILEILAKHNDFVGAKISGAGLGDCVIGIASAKVHPDLVIDKLSYNLEIDSGVEYLDCK